MPYLLCRNCDGSGQAGVKHRPDKRAIFQLGKPRCVPCQGTGLVPTDRNEDLKAWVRQARERDGCTYRQIAYHAREEFNGTWLPKNCQLVGETLCAEAGVDREAEFTTYCLGPGENSSDWRT